ncbi:unnamed protein product [Allacma fusca]|uniref:Glycosyltransferase family 92 protein n=1 Tax=Allacma fusca TaxID=39272 RepID=A0A8J2J2J8_9HEXA|nr:unnamed protein product [Allacma fusca]
MRLRKIVKVVIPFLLLVGCLFYYIHYSWSPNKLKLERFAAGETTSWRRISNDVFLYSAFIEDRLEGERAYVKVIGLKRISAKTPPPTVQDISKVTDVADINSKYYCKLFYTVDGRMVGIKSDNITYFVFEEGVKVYAGVFYKCYFKSIPIIPDSLSVALYPQNVHKYPDKLIQVRRVRRGKPTDVSICVRPLFGPMDDLVKLAQFIAYYEALGVSHFTFYDLSISPSIRDFLQRIEKADLMLWNLPTGNTSELWDFGTLTALHDCVYRSQGYVAVVDIDEFIVPSQHSSLTHLVTDSVYQSKDQFIFHNVFFCDEFCPRVVEKVRPRSPGRDKSWFRPPGPSSGFPIFSCNQRTKRIWGIHDRAKYIVKASRAVTLGHHYVTSTVDPGVPNYSERTLYVPPTLALLNHYRECRPISTKRNPVYNRTRIPDMQIMEYKTAVESTEAFRLYSALL